MSIETIISELASIAANPGKQLADFKAQGKKSNRHSALLCTGRARTCRRHGSLWHLGQQ